jgi:hypothetical protein
VSNREINDNSFADRVRAKRTERTVHDPLADVDQCVNGSAIHTFLPRIGQAKPLSD